VTFEWNAEDIGRIYQSMYDPTLPNYKYMDIPNFNYASSSYDSVMKGGKLVGFSMFGGSSFNERRVLSLGVVDPDVNVGDVLTLVWGEENGGTGKSTVERHTQTEVRVKVAPVPYARDAREGYHQGWRTKQV
jgi:vanillate/3-O-methylgallate O-demethylase